MARPPTLSFDRGTLLLHPPPPGKAWIEYATWDDRVEHFRLPALHYRHLIEALRAEGTPLVDHAPAFTPLPLVPALEMTPYPHQRAALAAWLAAGRRGVVVLPTGAGKTYLAQLALQTTQQSTLIVVPTVDLLHQWYAHLLAAFPDAPVGLLGGGSHDRTPLLVATYDSAAIHADALGNQAQTQQGHWWRIHWRCLEKKVDDMSGAVQGRVIRFRPVPEGGLPMSLHLQGGYQIPEETQRVARAAFPKGTLCLRLAETLGPIYQDVQFASLFPTRGQPAEAPARLALVTVLQFVEGLSDRRAADAVRGRIDWKYALGLALTDAGFDHTVLSEFRTRLVNGNAEQGLLDTLLERVQEAGLLKTRGRQRTDSTHVLAAVRMLNRLERVGETLRAALNALAVLVPEWLQQQVPPEWFERYGSRVENYHLPKTEAARQKLALVIGEDGQHLLQVVDRATDQAWLAQVPAMITLRRVWSEQYIEEQGQLRWREVKEMPAAADQLTSSYDTDARYSTKRHIEWIGYKVHFTETCDANSPHLIVNVQTTLATTPDDHMAAVVHASLKPRNLLPSEHLVDKGYTDSHILVDSQRHYGVTMVGPVADDPGWQAREGTGFDKSQFVVDWERQVVTCPAGKQSISWLPHTYPASGMAIEARFARKDCTPYAFRVRCTRAKVEPRIVGLQVREQYEALQAARKRQTTEAFQHEYAARSGIESTHEQAIRRCGLRRSRYLGLAKTHLQHLLTAIAINLVRLSDWWAGISPAKTRCSPFAALQWGKPAVHHM